MEEEELELKIKDNITQMAKIKKGENVANDFKLIPKLIFMKYNITFIMM
jgi:hypothetical protein